MLDLDRLRKWWILYEKKKEIKSTHKTEGKVVIATVDDIIQDMEVSVNGESPYI